MELAGRRGRGGWAWPVGRVRAWPAWLGEALAPTLVMTLALVLRWPYLLDWPAFTDESFEVLLSLEIARGQRLPWTNVNTYIGPWHAYLLAGLFTLGGTHIATPRALVMVLNVLAVGLTYGLGRLVAGRAVGLVAGVLVSLSPLWVLILSHVAWAASTAPTYVLGALLATRLALGPGERATWRAADRRRGGWLVLAGLLVGLAGQAHPTALVVAPALALVVAWGRAGWTRLGTPWPWLGLLASLLAYGPVLLFNLVLQPGAATREVQQYAYLGTPSLEPAVYLARAPRHWWAEARMVAGLGERGVLPASSEPAVVGVTLVVLTLAGWGAVRLWRRGERLVPLAAVMVPLGLPVLTSYSGELVAERYAAPLVALGGILAASGLTRLASGRAWWLAGLTVALGLLPVVSLSAYYQQRIGAPNQALMETAAQLAPARACIRVLLDDRLNRQPLDAAGTTLRGLRLVLGLSGVAWESGQLSDRALRRAAYEARPDEAVVAILAPGTRTQLELAHRLTRLSSVPPETGVSYAVYLYNTPALPVCAPR